MEKAIDRVDRSVLDLPALDLSIPIAVQQQRGAPMAQTQKVYLTPPIPKILKRLGSRSLASRWRWLGLGLLSCSASLLWGSPLLTRGAIAEEPLSPHSCLSIYYEEPYNSRLRVPEQCPPNQATRQFQESALTLVPLVSPVPPFPLGISSTLSQPLLPILEAQTYVPGLADASGPYTGMGGEIGSLPPELVGQVPQGGELTAAPLPENQEMAIATVRPQAGKFSLRLSNNTTTDVSYEIITHAAPRLLGQGESVLLKDLPLPVTITLNRPDGGFLRITPVDNVQGLVSLTLNRSGEFNNIQGVLTVLEDGRLFLD